MRHPTQWLIVIVVFLLGGSLLGRIICSLLGKPALADLVGKIMAISIVALIVLFVILYQIASWKFRKALKEQESNPTPKS